MIKVIAYKSIINTFGIEIIDIEHGINDNVLVRRTDSPDKIERRCIHFDVRPWFTFLGTRHYIDEFMRCNE